MLQEVLSVLYPNYCLGCGKAVVLEHQLLCAYCNGQLEVKTPHDLRKNLITDAFLGKLDLNFALCLFHYHKKGVVQQLLHQLKYKNQEKIGVWLGQWLGDILLSHTELPPIEVVVGVPIHPDKFRARGYNQVTAFGKQIADKVGAIYTEEVLSKTKNNSAQAKKNWLGRQKPTEHFILNHPEVIKHKNVLLVDDIITTGSTIIKCSELLQKAEVHTLGLACMAYVPYL